MLTALENKILNSLSLQARVSLSDIGQTLGVSRQVVRYCLNKLEEQKVIEGYYVILDIFKLGYLYHRMLFRFRNLIPENETQILNYFSNHKNVGWVCQYEGDWDLAVAVWTKNICEFEDVLDESLSRIGMYIEEKRIDVPTRIIQLKHSFLVKKSDGITCDVGGEATVSKLDDIDYNILGILTKDGRKSYRKISDALNLSPKIVEYRISKLLEKKIILGFNVKLNHRLLGYTHHKIFLHLSRISKSSIAKLIEYLKMLPNTIYITKLIGMADLEFELVVENNDVFYKIMRELRNQFPTLIRNFSSIIVSNEPCINYLPVKK